MQVATGQVASTGIVALSYVQKVSEKVFFLKQIGQSKELSSYFVTICTNIKLHMQVSLAADFMYNHMTRDSTANVGYDYILRQVTFVAIKLQLLFSLFFGGLKSFLLPG